MAIDANVKPAVIFLIGEKLTPALRSAGYMTKSMMGTTMMMKIGLSLATMSLGVDPRFIVPACETKLFNIWLYAKKNIGNQTKTLQATIPRLTSSTQASSNVIHLGISAPRACRELGLTRSQNSSSFHMFFLGEF